MKIKVRPAEQADAAVAVDVVRRSIQQLCVADHQGDPATIATWLANKTPENFLLWLANPDNFCVVAESGNHLSGVGLLHRSGEIRQFYLAPNAQRQGIGTMVHAELEAAARRWGLSALHLHSTAMARPFYEALGYHSTGAPVSRFGVLQCFPYAMPLQPDHSSKRTREKPRAAQLQR
jgi:GNAT superfamily N-acetyltransferase